MIMLITSLDKYIKVRKGAIHVGAHEGEERHWYRKMGFSPVIWFEPSKSVYERLVKNLENFPDQIPYNRGVHDTLEVAKLYIASNDGQSSSLLPLGTHAKHHPDVKYVSTEKVELVRLDKIFSFIKVDDFNFLNIDVQGVELNVIRSAGDYIKYFDYIYTEVNTEYVYEGCSLLSEIDEYLKRYDFIRVKTHMTKAGWGAAFYKKYQNG